MVGHFVSSTNEMTLPRVFKHENLLYYRIRGKLLQSNDCISYIHFLKYSLSAYKKQATRNKEKRLCRAKKHGLIVSISGTVDYKMHSSVWLHTLSK